MLAIVGAEWGLLVIEDAELEEGSALFEILKLGGEMSELRARGSSGSHGCNRKPLGCGQSWWCGLHQTRMDVDGIQVSGKCFSAMDSKIFQDFL